MNEVCLEPEELFAGPGRVDALNAEVCQEITHRIRRLVRFT
jgi:hypothetical protein